MTTVASLAVEITGDVSGLNRAMRNADQKIHGFANNARGAIRELASLLAPVVGALTIGKGIKIASDFQVAMNEISARTGLLGEDLERVREFALQMGADTAFSAQQAADAFLQLLSSGSSAEESIAALPHVMNLAAASGLDLGYSADLLTDTLKQFGLGVEDAAATTDILVRAAGSSSATVGDLAQGFANVGPVANMFGMSVDETAAALAVLAENGIKGAEGGTALKSMLLNLARPTKKTTKALGELGVSLYDETGTMRDFESVIDDLDYALDSLPMDEQIYYSQILAGSYGITAFNALRASGGIDAMQDSMLNASGAADVAEARMQGFAGAFEQLKGSLETLAIVGMTPIMDAIVTPIVRGLTDIVNGVIAFIQNLPNLPGRLEEFFFDVRAAIFGFIQELQGGANIGEALDNWARTMIGDHSLDRIIWEWTQVKNYGGRILAAITGAFDIVKFDIAAAMSGVREYLTQDGGAVAAFDLTALVTGMLSDFNNTLNNLGQLDTAGFKQWIEDNFNALAHVAVSVAANVFGGPFGAALGLGNLISRAIETDFLGISTFLDETGIRAAFEAALVVVKRVFDGVVQDIFGGGGDNMLPGMNPAEELAAALGDGADTSLLDRIARDIGGAIEFIKGVVEKISPALGEGLRALGDGIGSFARSISSISADDLYTVLRPLGAALGGLIIAGAAIAAAGISAVLKGLGWALDVLGKGVAQLVGAGAELLNGNLAGALEKLGAPGIAVGLAMLAGSITLIKGGIATLTAMGGAINVLRAAVTVGLSTQLVSFGLILGGLGVIIQGIDDDNILLIAGGFTALGVGAWAAFGPIGLLAVAIGGLALAIDKLMPGIVASWGEAFRQIGIFIDIVSGKLDALLMKLGLAGSSTGGKGGIDGPGAWVEPGAGSTPMLDTMQNFMFGKHRSGLDYVPYDGYVAMLHRGEQVLTENEARGRGSQPIVVNVTAYGTNEQEFAEMVGRALAGAAR